MFSLALFGFGWKFWQCKKKMKGKKTDENKNTFLYINIVWAKDLDIYVVWIVKINRRILIDLFSILCVRLNQWLYTEMVWKYDDEKTCVFVNTSYTVHEMEMNTAGVYVKNCMRLIEVCVSIFGYNFWQ